MGDGMSRPATTVCDPGKTAAPDGEVSTDLLLRTFFDLRLKGSKVEGDRAVLKVAIADDAKRTLKTYAVAT